MRAVSLVACLWICLFAAEAQSVTTDQLTGTWIGVHTEYDTDDVCPLPTYLQLDANGTYTLGMVDGSAPAIMSTWAVQGDSVRLDTIHFAPGLVKVQNNLLLIGTNYPMTFRKFSDVAADSANAYRQLVGRVWQSDSSTVSLYTNGRVSLESRTTKQRTAHFWRLAQFGQSVFLVILGNQYDRNGGYKPLWQLSNLSSKQVQFTGWNGRAVTTESFQFARNLAPGDSCRPGGFQTCDNCFRSIWYATSLTRSAKRYELTQLIAKHYHVAPQPEQSGLLHIEFVVNCEGQSGQFNVKGVDDVYRPKTFDSQLTNQLLAICRDHIATDPSLRRVDAPDARPQDVAVSLTFRLTDGQITDLLP